MLFALWHIVAFIFGVGIVVYTLLSAVRTFVLPRNVRDRLSRIVFVATWRLFQLRLLPTRAYLRRDRIMAFYAPISLMSLPAAWLALVLLGYTAMFWGVGISSWRAAFVTSGSSLLTLGFAALPTFVVTLLGFSEAAIGLFLVALLISYLPTIYAAWSRREAAVTRLEVRAGSPPSAIEMIKRYNHFQYTSEFNALWDTWEAWFTDIDESHTSLAALPFFRSPAPQRCWVTAAGVILDAAALTSSTLDAPHGPEVNLCLRAGNLALRHITEYFNTSHKPIVNPDSPISISRAEFDAACAELVEAGVALKANRDQAWQDFVGWRLNYDETLLALCRLTMAPPDALWSSDRLEGVS